MDKDQFTTDLIALFRRATKVFESFYKERGSIGKRIRVYEAESESALSAREKTVVDFRASLAFIADELKKTKEYNEFKNLLLSDERVSDSINCMVGYHGGVLRLTDEDLIMSMNLKLFECHQGTMEKEAEEIYNQLVSFYERDRVTVRSVIYLENVDFGKQTVKVDRDIALRKLSRDNSVKLLNEDIVFEKRYGFSSMTHMRGVKSLIDFRFEQERLTVPYSKMDAYKPQQSKDPEVFDRVFRFLDALRTMTETEVSCSPMYICRMYSPFDFWMDFRQLPQHPSSFAPKVVVSEDQ